MSLIPGSPMHYIAEMVKKQNPDAKTVFIGPCVAKRKEGIDNEFVDFVLSFSELDTILETMDIKPSDCEEIVLDKIDSEARGFALSGGVIAAIKAQNLQIDIKSLSVDGLNKKNDQFTEGILERESPCPVRRSNGLRRWLHCRSGKSYECTKREA